MDDLQFNKNTFLESYLLKHRELGKRQREYKKILSGKLKSRKETIIESSYENAIDQLEEEKNDLRAQIWVASGTTHKKTNDRCLDMIKCHVECQENLALDITTLKTSIGNMEKEISRVDKQIYNLNRLTVPDQQHQAHVAHTRKKMVILENALEVGVRQECGFTAANAELREQLIRILNHRTFFNDSYTKMVQKLNSDKKYLIDLIDYALNTFDGCIDVYEKIDNIAKREAKERDLRRIELQGIMRKVAADADNTAFLECKAKPRELADLQPKEYKRRDEFRRKHNKKINLYNSVLQKILEYTDSSNVEEVIEKFQQQESLYYSFFNYANEMSYHITLLNNSVNRLFEDIISLKRDNSNTLQEQLELISSLESEVKHKQESNMELLRIRENNDARLENLLQGVETLCEMCSIDATPLAGLLGDHTHVNLVNVARFLKLLEVRVQELTASVYVLERQDEGKVDYVVKQIEKICEAPTDLNDIVLTQQCPECAEGEAFNMDDGGDGVVIHTVAEAKKKLYEKITQPEMQYRLHSISQCRLPRSRLLAAKRNM
ncbi:coiled-coil domain-containing protein 63 [Drosophila tropicalis]|uniref:coiled-coil domain-containing protein 63 n=1 Tax=Drosophila tropicalis TaxID=46794 RepID=UPI0035ABD7B6